MALLDSSLLHQLFSTLIMEFWTATPLKMHRAEVNSYSCHRAQKQIVHLRLMGQVKKTLAFFTFMEYIVKQNDNATLHLQAELQGMQ